MSKEHVVWSVAPVPTIQSLLLKLGAKPVKAWIETEEIIPNLVEGEWRTELIDGLVFDWFVRGVSDTLSMLKNYRTCSEVRFWAVAIENPGDIYGIH